jgi:cold shock CspA family protein
MGAKDSEPVLPAFLEKRFAERRGNDVLPVYQPPADKLYEGSVKSISAKHGYGFVVCDETNRIYGRDVYLPKEAVPEGVKALDRLRFNLALSAKGHPQARNVTVISLAPAAAPAEPAVDESVEDKEAAENARPTA